MKGFGLILTYLVLVFALWMALVLMCGCSPRVITVPEVHTEYVVRTDSFVRTDSVHVNDSVFIREKGDTVWIERYRTLYRDRWRESVKVDTVIRRDSVTYTVEVEKPLTWWQRQKVEFGEVAMAILVGLLVFLFVRFKFLK